jgi:hypothetical protein
MEFWRHTDQRDEELQAAREDLSDFDHGKLTAGE